MLRSCPKSPLPNYEAEPIPPVPYLPSGPRSFKDRLPAAKHYRTPSLAERQVGIRISKYQSTRPGCLVKPLPALSRPETPIDKILSQPKTPTAPRRGVPQLITPQVAAFGSQHGEYEPPEDAIGTLESCDTLALPAPATQQTSQQNVSTMGAVVHEDPFWNRRVRFADELTLIENQQSESEESEPEAERARVLKQLSNAGDGAILRAAKKLSALIKRNKKAQKKSKENDEKASYSPAREEVAHALTRGWETLRNRFPSHGSIKRGRSSSIGHVDLSRAAAKEDAAKETGEMSRHSFDVREFGMFPDRVYSRNTTTRARGDEEKSQNRMSSDSAQSKPSVYVPPLRTRRGQDNFRDAMKSSDVRLGSTTTFPASRVTGHSSAVTSAPAVPAVSVVMGSSRGLEQSRLPRPQRLRHTSPQVVRAAKAVDWGMSEAQREAKERKKMQLGFENRLAATVVSPESHYEKLVEESGRVGAGLDWMSRMVAESNCVASEKQKQIRTEKRV